MGKRLFRLRKRMGLTTEHQEAMQEVNDLEAMIESQAETAKKHRPKYTAKRKKAETARKAAEKRLRRADSPERRAELENKVERLDDRVQKASERVQGLDRRVSKAAEALDDLDILRMDIELANDMEDIDYLAKVSSMKTKVTQDAMDEEMPGATFEAVCDEIGSLAEEIGEQQTSFLDEELVGSSWDESEDAENEEVETEVASEGSI